MRGDIGPIGAQCAENLLAERSQFCVAIEFDNAVASRVSIGRDARASLASVSVSAWSLSRSPC